MDLKPSILIPLFLSDQDVESSSLKTYDITIRQFFLWVARMNKTAYALERADIIQYKQRLREDGKSLRTIDSYLTVVRKFFAWCEINGYYQNITKGISNYRKPRIFSKESLTVEEINKLFAVIEKETYVGYRDYTIINIMLRAGLRRCEVHRMNVNDIATHNGEYGAWIQRKGRKIKDVFIPFSSKLQEILEYYIKVMPLKKDGPLIISLSRQNTKDRLGLRSISENIKKHMIKIGLTSSKYSAHSLRHTAADLLVENGANEFKIMYFMGHTNPNTTQLYFNRDKQRFLNTKHMANSLDEIF